MAETNHARVKALIGKMDATAPCGDGDNEAIAAFRFATKALATAGLTWQDVAEKAFGASAPAPQAAKSASPFTDFNWGGFSGFAARQERAQPKPTPQPKRKMHFNAAIHSTVDGTIRVTERRQTRAKKAHVLFTVESKDFDFVHLAAFDDLAEKIGGLDGQSVFLHVKPSNDPRWLPTATRCLEL